MKIVLYERPAGEYYFSPPGQVVEADLKDGHRVKAGPLGELMIFGDQETIGVTLRRAIEMRLLKVPK